MMRWRVKPCEDSGAGQSAGTLQQHVNACLCTCNMHRQVMFAERSWGGSPRTPQALVYVLYTWLRG